MLALTRRMKMDDLVSRALGFARAPDDRGGISFTAARLAAFRGGLDVLLAGQAGPRPGRPCSICRSHSPWAYGFGDAPVVLLRVHRPGSIPASGVLASGGWWMAGW
jgi:hypothetical protein